MEDREVVFRFKGDTNDLDQAIAKANEELKDFTDEEVAVAKAVKAANKQLDDQSKAIGLTTGELKSARTALKAQATAQQAAAKATASADKEARDAKLDFIELLGGPSKDVVDKLSKAQALLGSGTLAAGAAFVGAAAGVAIFTAAAFGSVLAADDIARSLMEIEGLGDIDGFKISQETLDSLDHANAAFDTISIVAQRAVVTLGEMFAPAVSGLSQGVTFLGLAMSDAWATVSNGEYVFQSIAKIIKTVLIEALLAPISHLELLTAGIAKLADLAGLDTISKKAQAVSDSFADFKVSMGGTGTVDALNAIGEKTFELAVRTVKLTKVMKDKNAADRESKSTSKAVNAEEQERIETAKALEASLKSQGDAQRALNKATEDAGKATEDLVAKSISFGAEPVSAIEKVRQEYQELDAELLRQIESNQKLSISTESLEDARIILAQNTKNELEKLRQEDSAAQSAINKSNIDGAKAYYDELKNIVYESAQDIASAAGDVAGLIAEKYADALTQTQARLEKISEALEGLNQSTVSAASLSGDALVKAYLRGEVAAEDLSTSQIDFIQAQLEAEKAALKEREDAQRKAAEGAFLAQQGLAVSQALIAGAVAIVQALAQLGPIAGGVAAIAIGATTAAQVAVISSQEPSFHSGGFVDAVGMGAGSSQAASYAPDEVSTRLQTGEAVLSRVGRNMIGDETIRKANKGQSVSPIVNVTQVYDGKVIGEVVQDQIKTSSALRRSIAKTRPGHRVR